MSTYTNYQGTIRYPSQEALKRAVKILKSEGYLDKDGSWIDETGRQRNPKSFDESTLTLEIPATIYRNLDRVIEDVIEGASSVVGKWGSTDGCMEAGYLGGESIDIDKYAADHKLGSEPREDKYKNVDKYEEALGEWRDKVVDHFLENDDV